MIGYYCGYPPIALTKAVILFYSCCYSLVGVLLVVSETVSKGFFGTIYASRRFGSVEVIWFNLFVWKSILEISNYVELLRLANYYSSI